MSYDAGETVQDGYEEERAKARDPRRPRQGPMPGDSLSGRQTRLWKAAETLDNVLDTLTERVAPVLLPPRPSPALASLGEDSVDSSDLGGFLDQLHSKLDSLARRAGELSERVDL